MTKSVSAVSAPAAAAAAPAAFAYDGDSTVTMCAAPELAHLQATSKALEGDIRQLALSLLLNGPDQALLAGSWGALRQVKSVYKTCSEVETSALRKAWNEKQEKAPRKTKITLNGLKAAAKAAGLIAPGKAPSKGDDDDAKPVDEGALAAAIVAILSSGTPAQQLKAIRALPEIIAAMNSAAEKEAKK